MIHTMDSQEKSDKAIHEVAIDRDLISSLLSKNDLRSLRENLDMLEDNKLALIST